MFFFAEHEREAESSKSSSPWTREKRLGLKSCTREVEREAVMIQLCIYEMEQKAVWPDLAWGSRENVPL